MKWAVRLLLLLILAASGLWFWLHFHPAPGEAIRRQLRQLAETATTRTNDGRITRLTSADKLADFFTQDASIHVDIPQIRQHSLEGRADIAEAAQFLKNRIRSVTVEFVDMNITVGSDKQSAFADLTAKITFPDDQDFAAQELKFLLKRVEGKWLILRVETVRAFN